jgi:hypothetical protein
MKPREKIIMELSVTPETTGLYDKLKSCIVTEDELDPRIDDWFKGVIHSLFYRPNKLALILEGDELHNSLFLRNLLYEKRLYSENHKDIYDCLLLDFLFNKGNITYPSRGNFTVILGEYPCDKRLASYAGTERSWVYPKRNDFIVIPVVDICWEMFHTINKKQLWIEIFNKFKLK